MRSADLEVRLSELHEAAERISANLVELEIDTGRELLDASTLTGASEQRWSAAGRTLTELWRRHGLLVDLLERADRLRGRRRSEGELRSLLDGPSIELASTDVPLAERQLLGGSRADQRCTPNQLLDAMSAEFDEVKIVIAGIGGAWDTLMPELHDAQRLLQSDCQLAAELGEESEPRLQAASARLSELTAAVAADPLSVTPGALHELASQLRSLQVELEQIGALSRGFETRLLEARELLQRLRTAATDARAAREELAVKISSCAVPAVPEPGGDAGAELGQIAELAGHGAWREASGALQGWTARIQDQLEQANQALAAARAPIEARNQLRGLLEAYQVKAARLGVLEEPDVAAAFARARDALYRAPTDLGDAAQLVRGYQRAIGGPGAATEVAR